MLSNGIAIAGGRIYQANATRERRSFVYIVESCTCPGDKFQFCRLFQEGLVNVKFRPDDQPFIRINDLERFLEAEFRMIRNINPRGL